ncbi:MATE family efflux transporter [Spirochaeta africana]|uniref:Multidrug export protein MepA n=1 Tax=Spirochaeta africana (strain ATCC 700263 / DSM 8902 / Z-7692) TaxID=889378 RepID=H9UG18_SPIAZ|nr:MATE family efflux transporter [Spirochaeta africana]AFG36461.1 putative efflux protein, MATE family [Spirochaeta africana DSM 8902]
MSDRLTMLREGPVASTLFKLSAPAIAGMVVIALYNVADTFFVSLLRDTTAVAATGIVFPMFQLAGAVGLTFGMGAASVISRRLGEGRHDKAHQAAATALYSAVVIGGLVSAAGAIGIRPLLLVFGATETVMEQAVLYGRIIIGGSVFLMVNMTTNNLLRSEGAALYSSMGQILGAVLNIALDPVFIFVFDMGITGAAVATVIAQACSTLFLLGFYFRQRGTLQPLNLRHVRLRLATYRDIMTLGLPTFVRQVLGSVSFAILNNAAATFGDAALAAISITFRMFMLLMMGLMGLAQGLQPLAGYNFGARQIDRVRHTIRIVFASAVTVGAVAGLGSYIFAEQIMLVFAPQDMDVVAMGILSIRYMALALIPVGLVIMFGGVFQALGDGRSALILAAGQQGVFLIPLVLILPYLFGLQGVFAAQPAGFVLAFLVGLLLLRFTWQKLDVAALEAGKSTDFAG